MTEVPLHKDGNESSVDKRDIQYAFENSWLWKKKLSLQHTGWLFACRVPLDTAKHPWVQYAKCYEAARWSPSSYNAQPTRAVGIYGSELDTVRFDFVSSNKSKYYSPVAVGIWLCDWEDACESIGVKGKFVILTNQEQAINNTVQRLPELPIYNISWVHKISSLS